MKKSFVILFSCLIVGIFVGCASSTPLESVVEYSEVFYVNGLSQDELYTKVNLWAVDTFKNADSVIQFSDKEAGVIKGKFVDNQQQVGMDYMTFRSTMTIEVKDGKYRVSFTDPMGTITGNALWGAFSAGNEQPVNTQEQADVVIVAWKELSDSLAKAINTGESDW